MIDSKCLTDEVIDGYKVSANRKKLWVTELNLLSYLEAVCVRENINYYLLFGSAIGAVRHKGFIPWDDDIDLGMLREDFEKFLKADKSDWPDYIDIQYGVSDHGVDTLLRIRDARTTGITRGDINKSGNKGAFIEIYVFDAADNKAIRNIQLKLTGFLERSMACCFLPAQNMNFKKKVRAAVVKLVGLKRTWALFDMICQMQNSHKHSTYVDTPCLPHYAKTGQHLFYRVDVEESIYVPFENTEVRIPKGYDRCLSTRYGDYMEMPPIEKRGTHHSFEVFYDPNCPYTEYENSPLLEQYFAGDLSLEKL